MAECLAEGDLLGIAMEDGHLHRQLVRIANNATVARLIEHLHSQHVRAQFRTLLVPGRPPRAVTEHRAIIEAIAARDPAAAEAAMSDHRINTVRSLRVLAEIRPSAR